MKDYQETTKNPKKLLFVITKSNWGGAQRYVYDLATGLDKNHFEVIVAFGGTGVPGSQSGKLADILTHAGIRTIPIPELGRDISITDLAALKALVSLFKKERPDIVHLNSSKAGGLGSFAARIARVPRIVFTAHGWPFWEKRSIPSRMLIFFFSYITVFFSDATICISDNDARVMRRMPFAGRKLHIVHNGTSPIDFLSREDARSVLFSSVEIEEHHSDVWVLSNGELNANKNYFVALDAIAQHNATTTQKIYYSIMSEGEQRHAIEHHIHEKHLRDQVKLLGFIPDGRRYYKAFDIFFLPSKKEGVPYVILEAALAEIPVVASRVGGIPEVIVDKESGLLVNPDDVQGFTSSLEALTKDHAQADRFATTLHTKVTRDYSIETMLKDTTQVYASNRGV